MKVTDFAGGLLKAGVLDHVGTLLIDNPARKNAVTARMWQSIPAAVAWLCGEAKARVILLKGAGDRDFSAGADISEFATVRKDAETARIYEAENARAFAALRTAPVPSIAAIRGICYGGGFGLAAACDIRIADETARFCIPPAKLGLAYPAEAVADIVAGLGGQAARYALYTGAVMEPVQALKWGFLLECLPSEALDQHVQQLCATIAGNAPLSVKASRLAIRAVIEGDAHAAAQAVETGAATFESADYAEGRKAFAEKRKPQFTGR